MRHSSMSIGDELLAMEKRQQQLVQELESVKAEVRMHDVRNALRLYASFQGNSEVCNKNGIAKVFHHF